MDTSDDRYKNVRKCLDEPDPSKRDACLAEATIEHLESIRSLNEKMMDGISSLHGDIIDVKNEMADGLDAVGTSITALEAVSGLVLTRTRILDTRTKKMDKKIDGIESNMATKDDVNVLAGKVDEIGKKIDRLASKQ